VRGTVTGTTSDSTGYFLLSLPQGQEYTVVFSYLGYLKETKYLNLNKHKEVELIIGLKRDTVEISEIVVKAKRSFEDIRVISFLDGVEFERLGQDDIEKALIYFYPDVVLPLKNRLKSDDNDFTLYVNKEWKSTMYLDEIDPYKIKYIQVWKARNGMDMAPNDMPLRVGSYVMNIMME
jgi:hypothetical protein